MYLAENGARYSTVLSAIGDGGGGTDNYRGNHGNRHDPPGAVVSKVTVTTTNTATNVANCATAVTSTILQTQSTRNGAILSPALEEVKVLAANAAAEFGDAAGAIVSTRINSGTNQLRGNLFSFLIVASSSQQDERELAGNMIYCFPPRLRVRRDAPGCPGGVWSDCHCILTGIIGELTGVVPRKKSFTQGIATKIKHRSGVGPCTAFPRGVPKLTATKERERHSQPYIY